MTDQELDREVRRAADTLTRIATRHVQKRIDRLKRELVCAKATIADLQKQKQ